MRKEVKEERIRHSGLKNIQIAFIFLFFGLLAIILYRYVGLNETISKNADLVILFVGTALILVGMGIINRLSFDKTRLRAFPESITAAVIGALVIGIVFSATYILIAPFRPFQQALLQGCIIFVCFLGVLVAIYFMKKRKNNNKEGESDN